MKPLYESVKKDKSKADKMAEDEAVKQLQYLKNRKIGCGDWLINCKDRQAIETILDLYQIQKEKNRQSKMRIVQLEKEIDARIEDVNTYYINKDEIRAKIKEYEEINMDVFTFEIAEDLKRLLKEN